MCIGLTDDSIKEILNAVLLEFFLRFESEDLLEDKNWQDGDPEFFTEFSEKIRQLISSQMRKNLLKKT